MLGALSGRGVPALAQEAGETDSGSAGEEPDRVVVSPGGGYWLIFEQSDGSDPVVVAIGGAAEITHSELVALETAVESGQIDRPGGLAGFVVGLATSRPTESLALACAADLPLGVRLGQTLVPGANWTRLDELAEPIAEGLIGGFVVLGEPTEDVAAAISALQLVAPIRLVTAVDEEGGRVQRLRSAIGRLPAAEAQAKAYTSEALTELLTVHGDAARELGFTMALAPVLDVGAGPGIGDRAYGEAVDVVAEYGLAAAAGYAAAGLVPVAKHFPGHGRASVDSHKSLPSTPDLAELATVDLAPFRQAIDRRIPAIMVGHLDVPGLTDGVPASLSFPAITGLLRGDLGFEGLVMTDSMDMGAIVDRWTTAEAVELALRAGADVVLLGNTDELADIHEWIADAVATGRLGSGRVDAAALQVLSIKGVPVCRTAFDQSRVGD